MNVAVKNVLILTALICVDGLLTPALALSLPPPVATERLPWLYKPVEHTVALPPAEEHTVALSPSTVAKVEPIVEPKAEVTPVEEVKPAASAEPVLLQDGELSEAEANTQFRKALVAAYEFNPRLKAAREAVKVLDENVAEANSAFRPNIAASYEEGRRRTRRGTGWSYFDTKVRDISIEQPIFTGGEGSGNIKASKARMKAGRAELRSVEQDVLLATVEAYAALAEASTVRKLAQNNVNVLQKRLDVTNIRFDAGDVTNTDVTQAQARLARSDSELRRAIADMETARVTFESVTGIKPGVVELPTDQPPLPATIDEAKSKAIAAFPQLRQAQYNELAADKAIEANIGEILPDVSLRGAMNRSEGSSFPGVNNFDNDSLTLNIAVPLYQSGAEYARLRAARKRYQQTRYQSADVKNLTIENVSRAWHNYKASLSVIESSRAAVEAGEVALLGVRRESEYGERTTLDVLDAEQEVFSDRVELVRAKRDRIVTAYVLLAATGGLNAEVLELPVELYDPIAHYDGVKWLPIGF